ncbi:hypothetical protein A2U01_0019816, partial [Trifolium medium]|nr:hypothetical protein [Trifolium medium]
MADNDKIQELQAHIKRNAEAMEQIQGDIHARLDRAEASHNNHFDQVSEALDGLYTLMRQTANKSESSHGNLNSYKPPFQVPTVKLDFPRFDGKHVLDWIFKAEQFFDYYNTSDSERLIIASVHLDSDAVPWFQMIQRSHPFHSWQKFTRALEMDFGPTAYDCPRATLFKLAQTGSVTEYFKEFNALANRVYGVSNEAFLDCFISVLQSEIRRDVTALTPSSITKAYALAKLYEEKYTKPSKPKYDNPYTPKIPPNSSNQTRYGPTTNKTDPTTTNKPNQPPLLPQPNQKPTTVKNISS